MAKVLANGQITIVDLNDGKAVQCFTQCSKGETQIYTPDTGVYTPNYSSSEPNVITARVYVTGSATDRLRPRLVRDGRGRWTVWLPLL